MKSRVRITITIDIEKTIVYKNDDDFDSQIEKIENDIEKKTGYEISEIYIDDIED